MLRSWMERLGRATIGLPRQGRPPIDRAGVVAPLRPAPRSLPLNAPPAAEARGVVVPTDNFS